LFVQLSKEQMTVPDDSRLAAKLDVILDMIPTHVILADEQLNLVRINLAARRRMEVSEEEVRGMPLTQILTRPAHHFGARALERVRDTGVAEEFDYCPPDQPSLIYRIKATPFPRGFALLTDEITDRMALREQEERMAGYEKLIDSWPGLARGIFNIRGIVTGISPALAKLIQADESRMMGVRFATLFDAANRGAISDAVEALLTDGKPFSFAAALLSSGAQNREAWVNAAPFKSADGQTGGMFLIGPTPSQPIRD
jgi:nitrogen-specific signal transduction histidine kinase